MNPFPLIGRVIIGGGVLALTVYELVKRGAKINKENSQESETMASGQSDLIGDVKAAAQEVSDRVKETVTTVAEAIEDVMPKKAEIDEIVENLKSTAKSAAEKVEDIVPDQVMDNVKEGMEAVSEAINGVNENMEYSKTFAADASKRTIKVHITKTINILLKEKVSGQYQIVSVEDPDLVQDLLQDYQTKYSKEIKAEKISIHHFTEDANHFLSVKF